MLKRAQSSRGTKMGDLIYGLQESEEPCIRYKILVGVLGENPESPKATEARNAIRGSPTVKRLLSHRDSDGRIPGSPYAKWCGAHWTLAMLADIGYPPGDESLVPLRDQVYEKWLSPDHTRERECGSEAKRYKSKPGVPIIQGRARRCASQEGNALYATLTLGIADERADILARNLCRWQWPDGGWNCDRKAEAGFIEDPRCEDALTLLESKRLPDGGFPAERKLYKAVEKPQHGGSLVDWGGAPAEYARIRSSPPTLSVF